MTWPLFAVLCLVAGILSGLVGFVGGINIVPALVMLFGFSQKLAQWRGSWVAASSAHALSLTCPMPP